MRFINFLYRKCLFDTLKKENIKICLSNSFCTSQYSSNKDNSIESSGDDSNLLKVAIIGCPNAGKSTVINQIVKRRVFAMSRKVHTTKCCARAVYNEGPCQIVFLDTPGLVSTAEREKYKLNLTYFKGGEDAIHEADIIGVVHDVSNTFTREKLDPKVLRLLHLYKEKESILIFNKVDALKSKNHLLKLSKSITNGKLRNKNENIKAEKLTEIELDDLIKKNHQWTLFSNIFMVSALFNSGIDDIRDYFLKIAKPGKWIFPPEKYTDKNPVHIIEEAVRARLLENLPEEVPYILDVQLEYLDMDKEELIKAVVLVHYSAERTGRLIAGKNSKRIQRITSEAEQEVADAFLTDVELQVVLKQKEKPTKLSNSA